MDILNALLQDVRRIVRALRRAPTFAFLVVITLALGIGATTAIFTIVDAAIGCAASLALGRLAESFLFGARVNPVQALRAE